MRKVEHRFQVRRASKRGVASSGVGEPFCMDPDMHQMRFKRLLSSSRSRNEINKRFDACKASKPLE